MERSKKFYNRINDNIKFLREYNGKRVNRRYEKIMIDMIDIEEMLLDEFNFMSEINSTRTGIWFGYGNTCFQPENIIEDFHRDNFY
jgi:hypothetical protein